MPSSPTSISAYGDRTVQRSQRLAAPECLRALAIASCAIRSSSYSTSLGQPWALLVQGHVHGHRRGRADLVGVRRQALAEPCTGGDLVPQVEDRVAQLGDDAGDLLAQLPDLLPAGQGRPRSSRGCPRDSPARRRPGPRRRGPRGRSAGAPGSSPCPGPARTAARPGAGRRACRGGRGARGRRSSRPLCTASRTRTAIISSFGDQRDGDVAFAQHHRLVLPAPLEELFGPGHRAGLGARRSSAAGPSRR